jgi:SAM-dependent methyltransferase
MLPDGTRDAADGFAAEYTTLRTAEGWIGERGREDPYDGLPKLWRGRFRAVALAARIIREELGEHPLLLDVGAGGGWAARLLGGAEVIGIDLIGVESDRALAVRGDMRRLPVRTGAADGALYAASLHYAPVEVAVREAARVLRPGGLLVAVDSPIYPGPEQTSQSVARAAAYYANAGHPALAASYHPIDALELRRAMATAGLQLERLDVRPAWRRRLRPGFATLVVASRLR